MTDPVAAHPRRRRTPAGSADGADRVLSGGLRLLRFGRTITVQIGQRESDFTNPLGLLGNCHRRIGLLRQLADT